MDLAFISFIVLIATFLSFSLSNENYKESLQRIKRSESGGGGNGCGGEGGCINWRREYGGNACCSCGQCGGSYFVGEGGKESGGYGYGGYGTGGGYNIIYCYACGGSNYGESGNSGYGQCGECGCGYGCGK